MLMVAQHVSSLFAAGSILTASKLGGDYDNSQVTMDSHEIRYGRYQIRRYSKLLRLNVLQPRIPAWWMFIVVSQEDDTPAMAPLSMILCDDWWRLHPWYRLSVFIRIVRAVVYQWSHELFDIIAHAAICRLSTSCLCWNLSLTWVPSITYWITLPGYGQNKVNYSTF
jgi:hypothetical protein